MLEIDGDFQMMCNINLFIFFKRPLSSWRWMKQMHHLQRLIKIFPCLFCCKKWTIVGIGVWIFRKMIVSIAVVHLFSISISKEWFCSIFTFYTIRVLVLFSHCFGFPNNGNDKRWQIGKQLSKISLNKVFLYLFRSLYFCTY